MIIYNGAKYSCSSCIRGHRSSTCRHTKRMLVKVRTRGRPSPIDIRDVIMVDMDSQMKNKLLQESYDLANKHNKEACGESNAKNSETNGGKVGCSNNKMMTAQPILFVRAKQTKKAMLVDGKLNIIMEDKPTGQKVTDTSSKGHVEAAHDSRSTSLETDDNDTGLNDTEKARKKLDSMVYMSERDYLSKHGNERHVISDPPKSGTTSTSMASAVPVKREANDVYIDNESKRKCCDPNHIRHLPDILSDEEIRMQESLFGNILNTDGRLNVTSPVSSIGTTNTSNNTPSMTGSELFTDIFDPKNDTVDVFTHKGIYLSADCSCADDQCQCLNCLIHRNEDELTSYIQKSGVPLTSLHGSDVEADNIEEKPTTCSNSTCNCTLTDCNCADCFVHPTEIIPFEKFYFHGILNCKLRRKTIIKYNNKLIPSEYWWNFLVVKVPTMSDMELEAIDMKNWFDKLLSSYQNELLDAHTDDFPFNDLEGFYVI
ncbi:similar to Saccharomyces cerevisiae YMR021C MAC1 Copper-sensing transcription factor involved in regulation of genes required for high affinity copper transport [Maudiozyma saulgeensis]|uniref:Similar to Saccharomyces cerevisiae YMR021C MAC1 Copper-sensing transcription factor involved in regulation of genes required for high affinity copper transport n=1 Tax=Maudiozyma saulgeensis TaxID=1789683 RepID=A0A1X7R828_9SACH|nr:similar to Saccharomyces cerevisiae YMR021C MAC1 Copper-sensing transcription factor involved in regulation of genes required for high affinity copper transport [Kazachstania saulgeensis]